MGAAWDEPATAVDMRLMRYLLVCAALSLAACSSAPTSGGPAARNTLVPTAVPNPSATVPAKGTAAATPRVTTAVTPAASAEPITLIFWTADDVSPDETPAGRVLQNQLDAFMAANPDIRVEVVPKMSHGKGGMLDFLSTTQAVIPERLPDLVAMDMSEVPLAVEAGLLEPLDELMPATTDAFPFATAAGHYRDHWFAVPYAVDVEHLVYNTTVVRKPPETWDDFTKQKAGLLLPLGGDDAFLVQYLALGAALTDASGRTSVDPNAAAQALGFFKRGHDLGLIPETALNMKSVDDVWSAFLVGRAAMAQVAASSYLAGRDRLPNAAYAMMPTRDGKPATIAAGWSLGIVSDNPAREAAAARFIRWITEGERLAPWLRAAHLLPANRSTVLLTVDPPEYAAFLRDQMERATALPPAPVYARQSEAWQGAISSVWKGFLTPEEAGRNVAQ